MMKLIKGSWLQIMLFFWLIIGFFYRINGLNKNYSFWTDEASTARFSRGILESGLPKITLTGWSGNSYYVTHYLTALSFAIFGQNEFAGRLPEVIFGTLLILVIYHVGKKIFNNFIGLGAAFLTTFSYIQIAWSRQSRGYVIFEVFFLLSLYFLYKINQSGNLRDYLGFLLLIMLTIWTHALGLFLVPISLVYLIVSGVAKKNLKSKWILLGLVLLVLALILFTPLRPTIIFVWTNVFPRTLNGENFLFYYHSLFWRQYSLISFLSFLTLILIWVRRKKKLFWLFVSTLLIYLAGIASPAQVPFEKYALPVFPIFYLLASYGLYEISLLFNKREIKRFLAFLAMMAFIVLNGNKFSLTPRAFYSMNFDMREIPEIDYKGIYDLVKSEFSEAELQKIPIVDLSSDMPAWYLGEGKNLFIPRKDVPKETVINKNTWAAYIHNLDEFIGIYNQHSKGIVVLVEHNYRFYPDGFVDFVKENLQLEKREEYAWFSPDWNRWPIELYSWEKTK